MSYFLKRNGELWQGKFSNIPEDVFFHAVSTRLGGVSQSPFDTLNLALHVGDKPQDVLNNRKLFIQSLGYSVDDIVTPQQVHGTNILRVDESHRGRGSVSYEDAIPETDALITNIPDLALMLCFADCVPVLFADVDNLAVGIAHAGWKGTVNNIAQKTFLAMQENFGTQPENCFVAIAPSICSSCYQVGENVLNSCDKKFVTQKEDKFYFDLQAANKAQLIEVGLPADNIDISGDCTCCKSGWYFSYRAANPTGRIAAVIGIRG